MNINKIILSEIKRYNQEGVGDKYLANKGIVPDEEQEFNKQFDAMKSRTNQEMGEFIGVILNHSNKPLSNVFLNPKNLRVFEADVRAVSDSNGNLFVAQTDGNFYHSAIADVVNKSGKYNIGSAYEGTKNVQWHRINKTNDFGYSVSFKEFVYRDYELSQTLIDKVQQKNPQFNFINEYWQNIKDGDNYWY